MDRSLYPEGVEVHQKDLERTETTKSFHIIERHKSVASLGLMSGSVVQNSGDATLINVNPIFGFSPNGELLETTTIISGLALADYTSGSINYVVAIYTEINSILQPHETSGESEPTEATRSVRIRMLTETEFNSLPESDDNLNNDAADRAMVVAKITARGVGVPIQNQDIEEPTTFASAITAVNPSGNITGVAISNIDKTTNTGTGTLSFIFSSQQLKWSAPGETFGAPVTITTSDIYDLPSSTGKILSVIVIKSSLPLTDQSDTIVVSNIYSQSIIRQSADDLHHRSLLGSGTPTLSNPHGLTLQDLGSSSGVVEIHQDVFHSNGIIKESDPDVLLATVDDVPSPDVINIQDPAGDDEFYINGNGFDTLQTNQILFTDLSDDAHAVFEIFAIEGTSGVALLERRERVRYTNASPPPFLASYVQLVDLSQYAPSTAAARILFDDGPDVLQFDSGTGSYGTAVPIPVVDGVVRLYDNNNEHFIDVNVKSTIAGVGTQLEPLTITDPLNYLEREERLHIVTALFSGSATGFVGYGFSIGNFPNTVLDKRLFGTLGSNKIRDDVGVFDIVTVPNQNPTLRTNKGISIGTLFPSSLYKVDILATEANQGGLQVIGNGNGAGIVGGSSGTSHGIYGYASGSGAGVAGYAPGSGHGVIARGKDTSPTKSSFRNYPQDIEPTNKDVGSIWTKTASGKPYHSNGAIFEQLITRTFVSVVDSTTHTGTITDTAFNIKYTIPANTLQVGSVIRVRAMCVVLANAPGTDGVMTLWLGPVGSGLKIGSGSIEMTDTDHQTMIDFMVVIREIGSGGKCVANGITGNSESFFAGLIDTKGRKDILNLNTSVNIDTTISCALADVGQQVVLRSLIVEVSG